jgi:hypothetical protein
MSNHYLIQVGTHTLFLDRIDGYGSIWQYLDGGCAKSHRFAIYLKNGETLYVTGTEAQCDEEQGMLLERLESISDPEPEVEGEHPVGQS